jgi:beta-lactamase regulating signal transducer with metallopeptidase domain
VQGILVVIAVRLCLSALPKTNAATRHAIWLAILGLLAALIPAEWCRSHWPASSSLATEDQPESRRIGLIGRALEAAGLTASSDKSQRTVLTLAAVPNTSEASSENADAADQNESSRSKAAVFTTVYLRDSDTTQVGLIQAGWNAVSGARDWLGGGWSWQVSSQSKATQAACMVLLATWATFASARLGVLLWRLRQIRNLKRDSTPAGPELQAILERCRATQAVKRPVSLRLSSRQTLPILVGFFRPTILLPGEAELAIDCAEVEQVLAHELGHVRRFDDWANLAQHFVQALLFFHPAVWWVSKRLALEREIACDDFVLQRGGKPRAYALLLVKLAGRARAPRPALAPGVSANKSQLQQRIAMILNTQRCTSARLGKTRLGFITVTSGLAAVLAVILGPRLVLAQNAVAFDSTEVQPERPSASPVTFQFEFAQSKEATPDAPVPESGPKFKPNPNPPDLAPDAPTPPEPRKPRVAAEPRAPRRAREAAKPAMNVEDRLDRLERMVETLVAQQKVRIQADREKMEEKMAMMGELGEKGNREVLRAEEDARRAAKLAEKAMKAGEDDEGIAASKDAFHRQIEVLQKQRELLKREMEKIGRQIDKIQHEQERAQERFERHLQKDGKESASEDRDEKR